MKAELPVLVVAIEIGEPALADRLTVLLGDIPGLRLAAPGEPADAALVIPDEPEPGPDVTSTPRELDVLALIAEGASNKAIARRLAISVHPVSFISPRCSTNSTRKEGLWRKARRRGMISL
jgi:Bacterial regulatory proteins, luxR family